MRRQCAYCLIIKFHGSSVVTDNFTQQMSNEIVSNLIRTNQLNNSNQINKNAKSTFSHKFICELFLTKGENYNKIFSQLIFKSLDIHCRRLICKYILEMG